MDITGIALDFIATYGLLAIFILLVMDGALMLPVFPGELVLIMAVAAYAHDIPGLLFIIGLTSVAGIMGSVLLYGVTRGGGRRLVERFPGFFMMPRKRRERLERSFQKPLGQSLVLFLRLLPLTRVLVNIPAGLARMPFVRFVVLSTIGLVTYHAAFLWFTYEARREGSAIATQKEQLEQAYASPAMAFVEANAIITGAIVVALGVVFSVRASAKMFRDPDESAGSVLGWLATVVLLWGGIGLAIFTYMDPDSVYRLIEVGGLDIHVIAASLGYTAAQVLFAVAAIAALIGFILHRVNRAAKIRRKVLIAERKAIAKARVDEAARAVLAGTATTTAARSPQEARQPSDFDERRTDQERSGIDFERSGTVDRSGSDVERSGTVQRSVSDVERSVSDVERSVSDVERSGIEFEERRHVDFEEREAATDDEPPRHASGAGDGHVDQQDEAD